MEPQQVREVLRCILHTIMFNRALGLVRPRDIDSELFEKITYAATIDLILLHYNFPTLTKKVQCGDATYEKLVEEKIDHLIAWVEKHPNKKSQVCLSFYETRNKHVAWFSNKVERLYWEQWWIYLNVIQPTHMRSRASHERPIDSSEEERSKRHAILEAELRDVLLQILQFVNEKKDHIPAVGNTDVVSFPYEIAIPSSSDSSFGDMFKRMLQTGPPTMLS
ncbi:hypothetical protein O6H91_06G144700 [Diphasiastrum complanatum]|uniref:Uncharacterized protein n=1 Tax=Diphasiastrum complanatum TaxID=34168 RepID=A0ACC2DJZ9_DIPCM|nr:hypothetical protein O6H91_06G144700 [Diphasiastrum complanatum]